MRFDLKKSTLPSQPGTGARPRMRPSRLLSGLIVVGALVTGSVVTQQAPASAGTSLSAGAADLSATDGGGAGRGAGASSVPRMSGGATQPSRKQMNTAHDHVMGAGVRQDSGPSKKPGKSKGNGPKHTKKSAGRLKGVDVSRWDSINAADWRSMAGQGIKFAYVKATEGTGYVSTSYSSQYKGAAKAGIIRGAYHFATPDTSSGKKQASYFVSHGGRWRSDGKTLPPLLDLEYNPYGSTCYGMSDAKMVKWISDFSATVKKKTGTRPAIYTTRDWWQQCTGNSKKFGANPLFIARYPSSYSDGPGRLPAGWKNFTFWQYTESGRPVPDMDVFNGGMKQLRALTKGA
jgi:GH25 family lysozyme M1 (1,4-beta-N-acetylmuramidase)